MWRVTASLYGEGLAEVGWMLLSLKRATRPRTELMRKEVAGLLAGLRFVADMGGKAVSDWRGSEQTRCDFRGRLCESSREFIHHAL